MPDLATEVRITDEDLADAIRVTGRQVRNGIKVLQLILDHICPETRRQPWNGQQDYYRNIPQPMRHQFLERLEDLATQRPRLDTLAPEPRSEGWHSASTEPVRTSPALVR